MTWRGLPLQKMGLLCRETREVRDRAWGRGGRRHVRREHQHSGQFEKTGRWRPRGFLLACAHFGPQSCTSSRYTLIRRVYLPRPQTGVGARCPFETSRGTLQSTETLIEQRRTRRPASRPRSCPKLSPRHLTALRVPKVFDLTRSSGPLCHKDGEFYQKPSLRSPRREA